MSHPIFPEVNHHSDLTYTHPHLALPEAAVSQHTTHLEANSNKDQHVQPIYNNTIVAYLNSTSRTESRFNRTNGRAFETPT